MTFGTPSGSSRMAALASVVPPEPPSETAAASFPAAYASPITRHSPFVIMTEASARVFAPSTLRPPSTSRWEMSASAGLSFRMPVSTRQTLSPSASSSRRKKRASAAFVSMVAIR